ncbi:TetR/AcrR family transcriptional regulator [Sporichthya polymorpha]|uniref:TetR/AcrR family transcriptional regulator n=1 Tax=Sporichthya polymorpha TaxID=35751 RepID=UPI000377D568|nr:TetR/AcrR family transcriptional regulator [Sporichthya polymorpha]
MARMTSEERRHRIATAAATVIVRDGLEGATTRAIAEEAGVPLGLIHYAFEDKQALFAAVYEHWMTDLLTEGIDVVEPGSGIDAAARTLARTAFDWITRDLNLAAAQYELLLWARRNAPALAVSMYSRWTDLWRASLQSAAVPGTTPTQVEAMLAHLLVTVDGVFVRLIATADVADARRVLNRELPVAPKPRAVPPARRSRTTKRSQL